MSWITHWLEIWGYCDPLDNIVYKNKMSCGLAQILYLHYIATDLPLCFEISS